MKIKNNNPKYCKISKNFLVQVYGINLTKEAKYFNRPFLCYEQTDICVVFPLRTNHKKDKYSKNIYYLNNKYFIDITRVIYVPKDKIKEFKFYPDQYEFKNSISEISDKFASINKTLQKTISLDKQSLSFHNEHKHIKISKRICREILEKQQEQNNQPEQEEEQEMSM